ncbi:threonine/serine exporter family protein [Alkaliphilus serpentinus]|uniref:Threonine/serine exporter n=1 Tax=Alkaliphilus serpentinus TaxID=1482731 RepID=A0A833HMK5_9FIRM|nr:threonine/serine exporter family protein [Alkaliphilus serpentinus]KAB3527658.1 threonine/serine exporter [Alkaliphilus serpentinus]
MLLYLKHFIFAFIATIGFAFLFNTPKSALLKSALAGAFGWLLFIASDTKTGSVVVSTFLASLLIGLIGEVYAITDKKPITVFIIPGIIPLVPGFKLYYTMISILEGDLLKASSFGSEALMITIAISGALTVVLSINSFRKRIMAKRI